MIILITMISINKNYKDNDKENIESNDKNYKNCLQFLYKTAHAQCQLTEVTDIN